MENKNTNTNYLWAVRKYAAIALTSLSLLVGTPAYSANSLELPVYESTRTLFSNSVERANTKEDQERVQQMKLKLAETKRNIAATKAEASKLYSSYTNSISQARTAFNESLKDKVLTVDEQKVILQKYQEAEQDKKNIEERVAPVYAKDYDFNMSLADANLIENLNGNISNHNQDSVTTLENSLKSQGIDVKVDHCSRPVHFPFASFFIIYWFFLRKKHY